MHHFVYEVRERERERERDTETDIIKPETSEGSQKTMSEGEKKVVVLITRLSEEMSVLPSKCLRRWIIVTKHSHDLKDLLLVRKPGNTYCYQRGSRMFI